MEVLPTKSMVDLDEDPHKERCLRLKQERVTEMLRGPPNPRDSHHLSSIGLWTRPKTVQGLVNKRPVRKVTLVKSVDPSGSRSDQGVRQPVRSRTPVGVTSLFLFLSYGREVLFIVLTCTTRRVSVHGCDSIDWKFISIINTIKRVFVLQS